MKSSGQTTSFRPALSPFALNVAVTTYLLVLCNTTFWAHLNTIFAGQPVWGFVFAFAIWTLMLLVVTLLAVRWLQKPVLIALLMIAGVTSYVSDRFGLVIDEAAVGSAFADPFAGIGHLMTREFLVHAVIYAALPIFLVLWIRIRRPSLWRGLVGWVIVVGAAALLCVALLFANYRGFSDAFAEHPELAGSVQPLGPISAMVRYLRDGAGAAEPASGTDQGAERPGLIVVVVGPASDAVGWALGGNARATNPGLASRDVLFFSAATSCGAKAPPDCPLQMPEASGSPDLSAALTTAGKTLDRWALGRASDATDAPGVQPIATDAEALARLGALAERQTGDRVLVLERASGADVAEAFTPACKPGAVVACSPQELANARDNAVADADRFLSEVIDTLRAATGVRPALVFTAPSAGTGLAPLVLWLPAGAGLDSTCAGAKSPAPGAAAATVLGLVGKGADDPADLTAGCSASGG